jgi:3-dehydroquinate synthase
MESHLTTSWENKLSLASSEASSILVIADSNLPKSYCKEVLDICKKESPTHIISFEGGEGIKTLSHVSEVYVHLEKMGADRKSLVVCLGGGTITDMGGFAASTYKRGVSLVHLPTTVLAMVDAAIGGKTGVNTEMQENFGLLKNQIGTFYNPKMVGINHNWLQSLKEEEILSGWGEMVKHALLKGGKHLKELMKLSPKLEDLSPLLIRSARIKEAIVNRDEKEIGERASLNLGHTVGHAIESLAHDQGREMKHGVAVAWGLVFALEASVMKMGFDPTTAEELKNWIVSEISKGIEVDGADAVWSKMSQDKKNVKGNVIDVLMIAPGEVKWDFVWEREEFTILWEKFRGRYT